MTERITLRSISPEIQADPPSWYMRMQFTTDKELDWATSKGLGRDIEARYPGSRVAMPNDRTVVIDLAVAASEEPPVEAISPYREILQLDIAPVHGVTFTLVDDAPLTVRAIEPVQEQPTRIGSSLTDELTYREMPPLTVVQDSKTDSQE